MKLKKTIFMVGIISLLVFLMACEQIQAPITPTEPEPIELEKSKVLPKFESCSALIDAFEEAQERNLGGVPGAPMQVMLEMDESVAKAATSAAGGGADRAFSETNIQVEGVDEADIIKTDGDYIYAIANNKLYIAKAYPVEKAKIISVKDLKNFNPNELFIDGDRLLIFGSTNREDIRPIAEAMQGIRAEMYPRPRHIGVVSVKLYSTADKEDPKLLRTAEFEGNYLSSRKIGSDVYFVVNSYPQWRQKPCEDCFDIIPLYSKDGKDFEPEAKCTDIAYIEPMHATNFITIASMSMKNEDKKIEKEVIVGSGQNIYASLENLYIAQTSWGREKQKTSVNKFALENGKIRFIGRGEVPGHILNQFSMDEFDDHFRIATTRGQVWNSEKLSTNNVYVLDEDLDVVGKLEDLAPGEKIYSVRFMGKKGYIVTFKKIDPLFVIDLSKHSNPKVLGKLKIPGYSDYLHPYDENHIIGIGKEAVEAESTNGIQRDFAWYQGIKMAIFDVTDVANPKEMHKVVIGDRGTDSPALHDHKAFLFDKEKNLLVIPVLVAEIQGEKTRDNQYGDFVFQGAYVYDISLNKGFKLKGKVSHYDDEEVYKKSGHYFSRDKGSIKRSLYIEDVLYTFSDKRLQMNSLDDLYRLKILDLPNEKEEEDEYEVWY